MKYIKGIALLIFGIVMIPITFSLYFTLIGQPLLVSGDFITNFVNDVKAGGIIALCGISMLSIIFGGTMIYYGDGNKNKICVVGQK